MYRDNYYNNHNDFRQERKNNNNNRDNNSNFKTRSPRSYSNSNGSDSSIDDSIGHLDGIKGDLIGDRYEICHEMGLGTFGKVFQCKDKKYNDIVAVKVIRSIKKYARSAKLEAKILNTVYDNQKQFKHRFCVKLYSQFKYNNHVCLVFEPLGMSVYDFIKRNDYTGFKLNDVKNMSKQLISAMEFLHSMNLIHTDLKLENILFINDSSDKIINNDGKEYYQIRNSNIKIIDFGGTTYDNDRSKSTIINTRQYRGPEVTLEVGWSFPSDMWSVGCMIAEIYSGELLFYTHDNLEHLCQMEHCIGKFPYNMIKKSRIFSQFFHRDGHCRLNDLPKKCYDNVKQMSSIQQCFSINPEDQASGIVELVNMLLRLDPNERASAKDVLSLSEWLKE
jgi:serine/threonine protein kinase